MLRAFKYFAAIIAVSLAMAFFGQLVISVTVLSSQNPDPLHTFWAGLAVGLITYIAYLIVFVVYQRYSKGGSLPYLCKKDFNAKLRASNIIFTVLIILCCIGAFMLLQTAFVDIFSLIKLYKIPEPFVIQNGWGGYLACVLVMCVMPALIEELLFRGIIFNLILGGGHVLGSNGNIFGNGRQVKDERNDAAKKVQVTALLVSAAMFAVYHLSFGQLVYQFILGLVFAGIYLKTRNLLYPMLAHFINNFFVVTYTFIAGSDDMPYSWNAYTVIAAIVLAAVGGLIIYRNVRNLKEDKREENHA